MAFSMPSKLLTGSVFTHGENMARCVMTTQQDLNTMSFAQICYNVLWDILENVQNSLWSLVYLFTNLLLLECTFPTDFQDALQSSTVGLIQHKTSSFTRAFACGNVKERKSCNSLN